MNYAEFAIFNTIPSESLHSRRSCIFFVIPLSLLGSQNRYIYELTPKNKL